MSVTFVLSTRVFKHDLEIWNMEILASVSTQKQAALSQLRHLNAIEREIPVIGKGGMGEVEVFKKVEWFGRDFLETKIKWTFPKRGKKK